MPASVLRGTIRAMNPIAELRRRLDNMIRPGTIYAVDHVRTRCRVKTGNIITGWLRYFVDRAGSVRRHSAPTLGEQCVVLSPSGEMAAGFVLIGINCDQFLSPSDNPDLNSTTYADGTWIGYDMGSKDLTVIMTEGGRIVLEAPAGVKLTGNLDIDGKVTSSGDVVAGGISVMNHKTTGVTPGNGLSGDPQ